ncbi:CD3073 family putative ECF transporter S component [Romboutsia sp. Marseille-P6047]|uniref:CD3073 family putative ECF transporter S component n=1 Tax=Romboutsia sp. Marseille-P6047 TaxID=2161817 RepID=UPI000F06CD5A|nr:CD3073 family putative ECF transporter S component [Romboutsia sp. Marseille-P6047]
MKNKSITFIFCIFINIILGLFVQVLNIPLLFLDTVGTIFGAVTLGPILGALIGGLSNIILGFVSNPLTYSYILANIALGLIVGFISNKKGFSYKEASIVGVILSIICPLISTPISLYLFGELNSNGSSLLLAILSRSNEIIFSGVFIPRLVSNMVDKIISCLFVAFILTKISQKYISKIDEAKKESQLTVELVENN